MVVRKFKHYLFYLSSLICTLFCIVFLVSFLGKLILSGYSALSVYQIKLPIEFNENILQTQSSAEIITFYKKSLSEAFKKIDSRENKIQLKYIINYNSLLDLHQNLIISPDTQHWVTISKELSRYLNHRKNNNSLFISESKTKFINKLLKSGMLRENFNWGFFLNNDSVDPQIAGIKQALYGSIVTIFLCMLISIPIGVITSIYVNFFLKRNYLYKLIKSNLINLASVPSIVYGIVGLFLFINLIGVPRSSILSGALTLAMLATPIMIVITDRAIQNLDTDIINAAYAMGTSKMKTIFKHVLPMTVPSIITGSILATSRVLGETAPLIMIGMVAYITSPPSNILSASTTLPVQIYLWSNSPDNDFAAKTSLAILALLAILAVLNIIAHIIKKQYKLLK